MPVEELLARMGNPLPTPTPGVAYLNLACRVGNLVYASGHVSDLKGKLGAGLGVPEGQAAAREACLKMLASVKKCVGTLEGVRVVRLLGMVNSTADFIEHHLAINGASDMLHQAFGPDLGYHARSAVGFVSLPTGVAVEIEGIFAVEGSA